MTNRTTDKDTNKAMDKSKFIPFYHDEKIAIFIDGSNLYSTTKSLDVDIDYRALLQWVAGQSRLLRAFYYTALVDDHEYSPIRPLVDWLDYNGYTMVTKPTKEYVDDKGRKRIKGNMDIELAIDVMEIADQVDHILLFSGDGDFRRLIEAVQRKGVRVTVVSTTRSNPPMVSDDLRRQADFFLELTDLIDITAAGNAQENGQRPQNKASSLHQDRTGHTNKPQLEDA